MKLIIDIPEEIYKASQIVDVKYEDTIQIPLEVIANGIPIPDNATKGKEVLIKYCLEHSGEEIYNLLRRLFDDSMNWTDSRGFIIEWLERSETAC